MCTYTSVSCILILIYYVHVERDLLHITTALPCSVDYYYVSDRLHGTS